MFFYNLILVSRLYYKLAQGEKKKSIPVLIRYIKDPINCLYIMGSTKFEYEVESLNFYIFVSIGVAMEL